MAQAPKMLIFKPPVHRFLALFCCLIGSLASCNLSQETTDAPGSISYEVYTTSGGDSTFTPGTMGPINQSLLRLFDRITDSTELHVALFDWTMTGIADRLLLRLKEHPGARAYFIFDPRNFALETPQRVKLRSLLRSLTGENGQIVIENDRNPLAGLIHTGEPSPRRRMHNKFFLFTHLAPGKIDHGTYTVAVSSANLTYNEVGESNEMVVVHGDQGLYERYRDYWQAMAVSQSDYAFSTTHTYSDQHDHKAFFFPKAAVGDEVEGILDQLETGIVATRQPAKIRIAMSIWHRCRKNIAKKLLQLQQKYELDVRILLKEDLDIALEVMELLRQLPPGSVRFLPSRHPKLTYGLHSKLMLLEGPYALVPGGEHDRQHLTFTGSHNWNHDAHRFNSENWLRIADKDVHAQLEQHWEELWVKGVDSTSMYEGIVYDSTGCQP